MSRLAKPPAEVPTLTDIVHALYLGDPAGHRPGAATVLSRELQKKIARRVVQRLGKILKTRLRYASQQPIGRNRRGLTAFLCSEIEQSVGDAVNRAFAQQENETAFLPKIRQRQATEGGSKSNLQKQTICQGKPSD